jgi:endonuclease/exonuclease/phosphatase family metal-dependent hydrolase
MAMSRYKKLLLIAFLILDIPLTILILFVINGTLLADNETPIMLRTGHPASAPRIENGTVDLKIMSYNIAKLFVHKRGFAFESPENITARLKRMSDLINAENPDIVFLSEAVRECTPIPINQIESLAKSTGMYLWVFGENYNFGLPFYRIVGGNAILSKWQIEPLSNISLVGRQPFYVSKNNRRALWCKLHIGKKEILLASLHNDSYSRKNNLAQVQQLLEYMGDREAVWAGDFNAAPGEPPIEFLRKSGKFTGVFDGPFTFPSDKPKEVIDMIFAPPSWQIISHKVIQSNASDHLPVMTVFRLPVSQ